MTAVTANDIKQMDDQELATLNKKLAKRLVKTIAVRVAVGVAIVGAAHLIAKKLESSNDDEN